MEHHPSLRPGKALNLRFSYLEPTYVTTHPLHLNPDWFYEQGIRGVIFDFDNTLISNHSDQIGENRSDFLESWIKTFGRNQVIIVSNKLSVFGMENKLLTEAERFNIKGIASGILIKPFPNALRRAASIMKIEPRKVLMIGDLLLTDILGGKLAGMQTLLVAPVHSEERIGIHSLRLAERILGYHAFDEHIDDHKTI
jgi:uncharacterized protein